LFTRDDCYEFETSSPPVSTCSTSAASTVPSARDRAACGVELWPLKTLSDLQRKLVNLRPKDTTVAAVAQLPMPHPTPTTRNTPFERQVWRVTAQIVNFKLEEDQDIHLVLFGNGAYVIAEMPAVSCLTAKTRDRAAIVKVRKRFVAACGRPTESWQPLGALARISGVGFWDFPHGQSGHASNYAELHPVTAIKFISGCGA
jgi:hypothetical protein